MSEEIRYGAGGVPYVGATATLDTAPSNVEEIVELELEEPAVKVTVTEKETPGEITTAKKGRKQK